MAPVRFQTPEELAKIRSQPGHGVPPEYDIEKYSEDKDYNKRLSNFTKKYTNSPEFERKMALYNRKPDAVRAGVNRFDPNKHFRYRDIPYPDSPARIRTSEYGGVPFPSVIEVDPNRTARLYSRKFGDKAPSYPKPEAHEMGHLGISGLEDKFHERQSPGAQADTLKRMRPASDSKAARIRDTLDHKRSPEEARADLHELRFHLHDAGIFDASKAAPFTQEHMDAYRKKTGQKHRIEDKFDDENLIWMMNNIAQSSRPSGMFTGPERYA